MLHPSTRKQKWYYVDAASPQSTVNFSATVAGALFDAYGIRALRAPGLF